MEQEIVFTNQPETEIAVKELIQQLKNIPDKYDAVFFLHLRNMTFHCFHLCFTTNFAMQKS